MATSSISVYQQQATKLLSRKSVILGIPIAAGSIILFLQWRKRKSLKPKPKPKKEASSEEARKTTAANGKAATHSSSNGSAAIEEKRTVNTSETHPASAPNGSATASATAPAPAAAGQAESAFATPSKSAHAASEQPAISAVTASPSISSDDPPPPYSATAADSPARTKHTYGQDEDDDQQTSGFAYAKRPRLGRGRSTEKFESYAPLRRTSAEKREEEEKLKIKEEDDKAAAAAVAAFSPAEATSAAPIAPVEPAAPAAQEDVPPEVVTAPDDDFEPASAVPMDDVSASARSGDTFEVKVNGWHDHEELWNGAEPVRELRRPSIIATFEIERTVESVGLSPHAVQDEFSRRPSVVTTISAEPPIDEEDEGSTIEWNPESRRESATVETTIEVNDGVEVDLNSPIFSTTISGPISAHAEPAPAPIGEPAPAALDAPPAAAAEVLPPADVDPVNALAKALNAGVRDGEEAQRTDSPLSSKPVVVAAAEGVSAPHSAVVEDVERAPLAHLPGMGRPNRA
ncbi:hypothetical protein GTA08_BOTSDO09362 [Neofusicoccum parvum]|uniref:Uncharacterized protein n=1 Tax=Neofusicoccum parvum TaxID=310453 RepID=A0ACB5RRX5_9PEZI|nr:hypothetical protein GTA08_BOTSDO09362 [Neofusicoccum parvum]